MELEIHKQGGTSITEDLGVLKLGKFTILSGENNSGKTNIIKTIISQIGEEDVIYIPAEKINAEESTKTSASEDPMRKAISKLLNISVGETKIEGEFNKLFENIVNNYSHFEIPNTELKLTPKDFKEKDLEKILKDALAARILDSKIIDKHGTETEIKISAVGQGVQRLIIASIIQELGKVRIEGEEILILFEEPEIYLHPKLKSKLYKSLFDLSQQDKIRVVITTHDPQFIELGRGAKIYKVFRDSSKNGSTQIKLIDKPQHLTYSSSAEINYQIFDLPSPTYFLELYENKKSELEVKKNIINGYKYYEFDLEISTSIGEPQSEKDDYGNPVTFITRLRHDLAHATGSILDKFEARGKEAIEKLQNFIP